MMREHTPALPLMLCRLRYALLLIRHFPFYAPYAAADAAMLRSIFADAFDVMLFA